MASIADQTGKGKILDSDLSLAAGVIGILAIMILPLPPILLDVFLALNITFSVLILFVALYSVKPLDFSTFPSILLITTLFRLSLNVSSTRLILLNGNKGLSSAGEVIRAFGNFVVGGNYIVGIIVFLILVLINFIVISKGAGRIAEVGARFTLDAMPGKQMAIDADLNAGIIDEPTAQSRRELIQREADFFGSMDGASKFVRGDAIAGLIITAINIIGGLVVGVIAYNMQLSSAAETFTVLTVGDGLVSQIPALIISTAAGIVVSKAGAKERLGKEFSAQLFRNPKALNMASGALFILGIVPGMPKVPFFLLSGIFAYIGWTTKQTLEKEVEEERLLEDEKILEETKESSEDISSLLPIDLLGLELGYALIPLVDPDQDGELLERVKSIRKQVALDMGFVVPPVHIKDNLQLEAGGYSIIIKGIEVGSGEMMMDHLLAMKAGEVDKEIHGIETVEPAFGLPAVWISEADKEEAQIYGYTVVDIPTVIATHITEVIKSHSYEFLNRQGVQNLLDNVNKTDPKIVEELIPDPITLGSLQRVLQSLLRENVSIRDIGTILEALGDVAHLTKDIDTLVEHVRQALARNITRQYQTDDGTLPVMTLDQELENVIAESIKDTGQGAYLALDPEAAQSVISLIENGIESFSALNFQPILLCSPIVRPHLKALVERFIPNLVILSHNEISQDVKIDSLGMIEIPKNEETS